MLGRNQSESWPTCRAPNDNQYRECDEGGHGNSAEPEGEAPHVISAGGVGGWLIAGTFVRHRSVRHTEPAGAMAEESSAGPRESENRQRSEGKQALKVWHDCGLTDRA